MGVRREMKGNSVQMQHKELVLQRAGCTADQMAPLGWPAGGRRAAKPGAAGLPPTRLWASCPVEIYHQEAVVYVLLLNASCPARKVNVKGSVRGSTPGVGEPTQCRPRIIRLPAKPVFQPALWWRALRAIQLCLPHGWCSHSFRAVPLLKPPPMPKAPTSVPPMAQEPGCFRGLCWLPFERFLL